MGLWRRIRGAWWALCGWDYRQSWERATGTIKSLEAEKRELLDRISDLTRRCAFAEAAARQLREIVDGHPTDDTILRDLETILAGQRQVSCWVDALREKIRVAAPMPPEKPP